MYMYHIRGEGYDSIAVDYRICNDEIITDQYYVKDGNIIKTARVHFLYSINNGVMCLSGIVTDEDDTVVLPKSFLKEILPYSLKGTSFKRLVIPAGVSIRLDNNALFGSDTLEEYMSLSNSIRYGFDVFPETVKRRYY